MKRLSLKRLAIAGLAGLALGTSIASAQPPMPPAAPARTPEEIEREFQIQLEPPSAERLYRIESEARLRERIRQEFRQRNERAEFPKEVPIPEKYADRGWALQVSATVPGYVCYRPLYFEDLNAERHAWDFCVLQPIVSTARFVGDTVLWPARAIFQPPWDCECNTGYYLPGDCVPYLVSVPTPSLDLWPFKRGQSDASSCSTCP